MLERVVRRLNSKGSSNRIVSLIPQPPHSTSSTSSQCCYRSRRMLHSAFWVHGATVLDFPNFFFGGNHCDEYQDEVPVSQQQHQQSAVSRHVPESVDLEFLYPPKALALIRRFSSAAPQATSTTAVATRRHAISPSALLLRYCRRLYSSSTEDSLSAKDIEHHQTLRSLARQSLPHDSDIETHIQYPTFEILMESRKRDLFDLAWKLYNAELGEMQKLDIYAQNHRRNFLMKYLSRSGRKVDLQRCIEVGSSIAIEALERYSCRSLVFTLLKLGNTVGAGELLLAYVSTHKRINLCGIEDFLAEMLTNKEWNMMMKVWGEVMGRSGDLSAFMILNHSRHASEMFLDWLEKTAPVARNKPVETFSRFLWKGALNSLAVHPDAKTYISYRTYLKITEILKGRKWLDEFSEIQKTILDCLNNNQSAQALELYESIRKQTNEIFYSELLNGVLQAYVQAKNYKGVKMIFQDFVDFGIKPDETSYNIVMKAFAAQGETGIVDQLLRRYLESYELTPQICCHVLRSRAMRGEMGAAMEFLNAAESHGVEPDLNCFNTVMVGYSWTRDMHAMLDLLKRIIQRGYKPNRVTFGALMYICSYRGDVDNTKFLMRLAELSGQVSFAMYNFLVMAHVRVRDIEMAEKIVTYFESVSNNSKHPHVWNSLLNGHAVRHSYKGFTRVLALMEEKGIKLDLHTYALHIWILCKKRRLGDASQVLEEAASKLKLNSVPFNILITTCIKERSFPEIWKVYDNMVERGVSPSYATYALLIQAAVLEASLNLGDKVPVEEIVLKARAILQVVKTRKPGVDLLSRYPIKSAIPPDVFVPIMKALLRYDHPDKAAAEYEAFLQLAEQNTPDGAEPDRMILTPLMLACLRLRRWDNLRDTWKRLKAYAVKVGQRLPLESPEPKILDQRREMLRSQFSMFIDASIQGKPGEGNAEDGNPITFDEVDAEKKSMERLGFFLDNKNWNDYVCAMAHHGRLVEAFQLCEQLLMDGFLQVGKYRWHYFRGRKTVKRDWSTRAYKFAYNSTIWELATEMHLQRKREEAQGIDVEKAMNSAFGPVSLLERALQESHGASKKSSADNNNNNGSSEGSEPEVSTQSSEKTEKPNEEQKSIEQVTQKAQDEPKEPQASEKQKSPVKPKSPTSLLVELRKQAPRVYTACTSITDIERLVDQQLQRRLKKQERWQPWAEDEPPSAEDMNPVSESDMDLDLQTAGQSRRNIPNRDLGTSNAPMK